MPSEKEQAQARKKRGSAPRVTVTETKGRAGSKPDSQAHASHSKHREAPHHGADRAKSSQEIYDPLLECLWWLSRSFGSVCSRETLTSGLPLPGGILNTTYFPEAALRAGLSSRRFHKDLRDIKPAQLPCVLILKGHQACVLLELDLEQQQARVMMPGHTPSEDWVGLHGLQEQYQKQLFLLKREFRYDKRSPDLKLSAQGHWFWSVILRSTKIYRDVLIASFLINLFGVVAPLFTMNAYDKIVPNLAFNSLWVLATGAGVIFIFDFIIRQLRSYFIDVAGKKSDVLLSARIFARVMGTRLESRPISTGAFVRHLQEFESIRDFLTSATITSLVDLPFSLLFLLVIWIFAGNMVWVPLVAMLILLIYSLLIQPPLRRSVEEGSRLASQKHANLVEGVAGLETVKLLGAEGTFQFRWEQAVNHMANWGIKSRKITNSVAALASYMQQMVIISLIVMGVYQISIGELSMGGLIASVMLSSRAISPMIQMSVLSTRYNQAKAAFKILTQIMDQPVESEGQQQLRHPIIRGNIEFSNVSFAYPGSNLKALDGFSIKIKAGEKIGIIGRIGAGKSTLQRLLTGLYQPTEGTIRVDGIDLSQFTESFLRRNIGCVPQQVTLFYGSIRENISLGQPWIDDDQLRRCARRAGVTQFTRRDPNGLERQVGEGGRNMSGGQRQTIALARAFLNDPPIMILDEPTSDMDFRTEALVRDELKKMGNEHTLLLITHRTSILDLVDRLIVLENGRLVADGPKQTVMRMLREGKIRASYKGGA
ncbi:type I secretion system permease/ATPase [Dongshaea marina]|uniref:type I secretion system permease/ATPase n=1 Tax=Dongshaea marina TaxID=2047966 RepID=UPI000D3E7C60|nr:type I secretion system permease/ATPase [Dongshaea marina]